MLDQQDDRATTSEDRSSSGGTAIRVTSMDIIWPVTPTSIRGFPFHKFCSQDTKLKSRVRLEEQERIGTIPESCDQRLIDYFVQVKT